MQRTARASATICTVALAMTALAACGSDEGDGGSSSANARDASRQTVASVPFSGSLEEDVPVGYPEPERAAYRIAYLEPIGANEFVATVGEAARVEASKLGGSVTVYDAELDPDRQVSQFQQALAQDVDGIYLFAVDPRTVEPLVRQAKDAGVPVIGVEANSKSTTEIGALTGQLWERREEQAYLQVKALAGLAGSGSPIAQITSSIPSPVIQEYLAFQRQWATRFGADIVGGVDNPTDDIAGGEKAMTGVLARYPDIEGLLPYNDPSGIGAAAAVRQQGRQMPIVGTNGGSDGLDGVRQGKLQATVKIDAVGMGRFGVWGIYNALQGAKVPKTAKIGPPKLIDERNIDSTPSWQQEIDQADGR